MSLGPGVSAGAVGLLTFVTVQRLAELVYARANERRLRERGAVELGADHYGFIVALHAAWLIACWAAGWSRSVLTPWLLVFVALQAFRLWVLGTLGRRWTTRVLVVPGEVLVRRGPYRWISHPNYLLVALEIVVVPLALGLVWLAVVFGALNLAMLAWRIRVENSALSKVAEGGRG